MDRSTIRPLNLFIVLCSVTVTVFAGTFSGGFHYDDFPTILENPHLDGWRTFVGHLDHMVRPVLYGPSCSIILSMGPMRPATIC